jgi:pilus assembly protein CpaE
MPATDKTSVVVVDDTDESREMILRMLQFDPTIEVVGKARTGVEAIDAAQKLKPDVMVMDINMPDMDGITATEQIRKKHPFIQIVILSVQNDANYMRKAMLAGARDFLTKPPMIDELTVAIRRAGELARSEKEKAAAYTHTGVTGGLGQTLRAPVQLGKIICIYSPKGGVGCTTVATNLAVALKTAETQVCVVDTNMIYGDVGVFFNEHGKNSILDLVGRANELDVDVINDVIITNKLTDVQLMPAPKDPEFSDARKGEAISKILTFMRQMYNYVIIDTTPHLTEFVQTSLDIADFIILLSTQDIPAIKNTHQFLSIADSSQIGREKIMFVLNRYDKRIAISPERIGESLKQPVVVSIPFEEKIISNSINRGVPFMVDNKTALAAKAIMALHDELKKRIQTEEENL